MEAKEQIIRDELWLNVFTTSKERNSLTDDGLEALKQVRQGYVDRDAKAVKQIQDEHRAEAIAKTQQWFKDSCDKLRSVLDNLPKKYVEGEHFIYETEEVEVTLELMCGKKSRPYWGGPDKGHVDRHFNETFTFKVTRPKLYLTKRVYNKCRVSVEQWKTWKVKRPKDKMFERTIFVNTKPCDGSDFQQRISTTPWQADFTCLIEQDSKRKKIQTILADELESRKWNTDRYERTKEQQKKLNDTLRFFDEAEGVELELHHDYAYAQYPSGSNIRINNHGSMTSSWDALPEDEPTMLELHRRFKHQPKRK